MESKILRAKAYIQMKNEKSKWPTNKRYCFDEDVCFNGKCKCEECAYFQAVHKPITKGDVQ